jgi:presenilin-like A22 family membrane protease
LAEQTEAFKAKMIYLAPIFASLIFGLLCASLLQKPVPSAPPEFPVTPIPQTTPEGPYFNAVYFLIIVGVGAIVIYLLIKYRNRKTLNLLTGTALTTAFLLLSFVYFSKILSSVNNSLTLVIILSIVIAVIADIVIFRVGGKACDIVVIGLGGALGVFFGANLNFPTALIVLSVLAVYDIVAVFYGPVGKIAESGLEQLKGLSFSFKEIQMGLGDLVFFSLLIGNLLVNFNLLASVFSLVGILTGTYLTFLVLEKREVFPGLPFPIAMGTALGAIAAFVL